MTSHALSSLFEFKAWADADLLSVLEQVPVHQNAILQASLHWLEHVHRVDRLFQAVLEGAPRPFETNFADCAPSLKQLRPAMIATDAWFVEHVSSLPSTRLAEVIAFTFTDGRHGSMSREEILLHVLMHGVYHKGNVGQLLMSASITPPHEVLTRFLHLREPDRRMAQRPYPSNENLATSA